MCLFSAIAKDTALRKELLSSLELAKSSLRSDIENLEKSLNCEKEAHCETKNRLMLQEHECATLRVDRRRYVIFYFKRKKTHTFHMQGIL